MVSSRFRRENTMPRPVTVSLGISLLFVTHMVGAQSTLGELLDGGAKKVSASEFREELVQKAITGALPTGGTLEVTYITSGLITGVGTATKGSPVQMDVSGTWVIDDNQRICTSMLIASGAGSAGGGFSTSGALVLPPRCQFWFKYGDYYYLSDSDSDRHARVIRRAVKPAATARSSVPNAPLTLPKSMKGVAYFQQNPAQARTQWSLAVAKTNDDGTFEGFVTIVGRRCGGNAVPITNAIVKGGEVRFKATMAPQCHATFTLRSGSDHFLEGELTDDFFPGGPAQVWLDPDA
jgi:hypothetical protein